MSRPLLCLLAVALACAGAACRESSSSLTSGTTPTTESTIETPTGDDSDRETLDREMFERVLSTGFGPEGAECLLDELEDSGLSADDISTGLLGGEVGDPALTEAIVAATQACIDVIDFGGVADVIDLDDPLQRRQFLDAFSASSGLSAAQAECVLDVLEADGYDVASLIGQLGGDGDEVAEAQRVVTAATEGCI